MASASGPPKDLEEPVHGRGQREPQESISGAAATSTDASVAAAAEGGAVVSPPPPPSSAERLNQQPGDGGRGTDGSSPAAAAVARKGKKKIGEQAQRKEKSDTPKKKLLHSSILAFQGYVKKKFSDRKGKQPDCPNQNSRARMSKSPPHVGHKEQVVDTAFEMLIEKIKGWKRMLEHPTSTLRLVAAIWMCTHSGLYGRRITGLGEGVNLEDWCSTQVIPPRVHADLVTMSAMSRALGVAVRVEDTLDGRRKDLLAGELHSAVRGSKPHARRIEDIYCTARNIPRVTLVRIYSHYDILYPLPPGATSAGSNLLLPERQGQGQGQGGGSQQHPDPAAETSSRGAAQGDPGAETSSRRAAQGDLAESSRQGAARARWFHCCIGGSKKQS
ncbi:hypothetical protein E2562_028815 [Oryza meyeriana var. granulata]|uniref:Uncharacterized protein n=1 Tax=Oryza meyeriana var. granulata TaxID=110450 RepID=A0A6G1FCZ3_9ORYZ|nr:hypothetical protein E2562_028815 [Oryza meyeriana var. granulata]